MLTVIGRTRSTDDHPTYPRARLAALFRADRPDAAPAGAGARVRPDGGSPGPRPDQTAERGSGPEPETGAGVPPEPSEVTTERPADVGRAAPSGWFTRVIPAGWHVPRTDPGRRGGFTLLAVLLVGAGLAGLLTWRARPTIEPVAVPPARHAVAAASTSVPVRASASVPTIVVAVAGRVRHPGIVTLARGARVVDAVRAAGGPVPGTDLGLLNLARPLGDGEQVVVGVPAPGPAPGAGPAEVGAGPVGSGTGGPVNLNAATVQELVALPGVGPVTAQRIVDWRARHGRFTTVDQLREVSGIGPAKLARIRDRVTV